MPVCEETRVLKRTEISQKNYVPATKFKMQIRLHWLPQDYHR